MSAKKNCLKISDFELFKHDFETTIKLADELMVVSYRVASKYKSAVSLLEKAEKADGWQADWRFGLLSEQSRTIEYLEQKLNLQSITEYFLNDEYEFNDCLEDIYYSLKESRDAYMALAENENKLYQEVRDGFGESTARYFNGNEPHRLWKANEQTRQLVERTQCELVANLNYAIRATKEIMNKSRYVYE